MFTCNIPSHIIFSSFLHVQYSSPYNLFCKVNNPHPLINRSRTHMYAKYKREWTPRAKMEINLYTIKFRWNMFWLMKIMGSIKWWRMARNMKPITLTNNIEYTLNRLISYKQPRTIHMLFFTFGIMDMIWYCTYLCTCMQIFTLIVRKYVAKPNEKIFAILNFVQVAYKIFSWSSNPYSSTQHQFFVACSHKAPCNHVHWNWETFNINAIFLNHQICEVLFSRF
jgi:hypothetical protein